MHDELRPGRSQNHRPGARDRRDAGDWQRRQGGVSTNRRQFIGGAGALAAASTLPCPVIAQAKPKVVVIGGGPGGATAAKYIARDSNGAIDVTLVEPDRRFVT